MDIQEHVVEMLNQSEHNNETLRVRFYAVIVVSEIDPAIFPADGCVFQFWMKSLEKVNLVAGAEVVFKMNIDLDILRLVADPVHLKCHLPSIQCHPVRATICIHALDAISVDDSNCLSVYLLAKTEHFQVPRSDEVRVYHTPDLGRQLKEETIRPQHWA